MEEYEDKNNQFSLKNNSLERKIEKLKSKKVYMKEEILKYETRIEQVTELNSEIVKFLERLRVDVQNYFRDVKALERYFFEQNTYLTKKVHQLLAERAEDKKEIANLHTQIELLKKYQLAALTKTNQSKTPFEDHEKEFHASLKTLFEDERVSGQLNKLNQPENESRVRETETKVEDHNECFQENAGSRTSYKEVDETSESELKINK